MVLLYEEEDNMEREALPIILYEIIKELGGRALMIDVFKSFWDKYHSELLSSGDLFYTWNYDIRWAATNLRRNGLMKQASRRMHNNPGDSSPNGIWEIL